MKCQTRSSRRFWLCIAAAVAVIVFAVPAASGAGVHKYDTKVTITQDRGVPHALIHGDVKTVDRCEKGRRVVLFKQRPGADRKLGTDRSGGPNSSRHTWGMRVPGAKSGWHVYAKVRRDVRADGDVVCRPDRSRTYTVH